VLRAAAEQVQQAIYKIGEKKMTQREPLRATTKAS